MVQENRKMISVRESTMARLSQLKLELNAVSVDALINQLVNDFVEARK